MGTAHATDTVKSGVTCTLSPNRAPQAPAKSDPDLPPSYTVDQSSSSQSFSVGAPHNDNSFQTGFAGVTPTTFAGTLTVTTSRPLSYIPVATASFVCQQRWIYKPTVYSSVYDDVKTTGWQEQKAFSYRLNCDAHPIPCEFTRYNYIPEGGSVQYTFEIPLSIGTSPEGVDWLPDAHSWGYAFTGQIAYSLSATVKSDPEAETPLATTSVNIPFTFYNLIVLTPPADRPPAGWFKNEPLNLGTPHPNFHTPTDLTHSMPDFPYLLDLSFTSGTIFHIDTKPTLSFYLTPKNANHSTPSLKSVTFNLTQYEIHDMAPSNMVKLGHLRLEKPAIKVGQHYNITFPIGNNMTFGHSAAPSVPRGNHLGYEIAHVFECIIEVGGFGFASEKRYGVRCLVDFTLARLGDLTKASVVQY
ncbi:hypothetical protein HDV00_002953 [Rhizophlyctis rosea]|nr:hypothetical protein HDV00_002953 [Rhizophlyctis rosea]